jgi:hypothetical protein
MAADKRKPAGVLHYRWPGGEIVCHVKKGKSASPDSTESADEFFRSPRRCMACGQNLKAGGAR